MYSEEILDVVGTLIYEFMRTSKVDITKAYHKLTDDERELFRALATDISSQILEYSDSDIDDEDEWDEDEW